MRLDRMFLASGMSVQYKGPMVWILGSNPNMDDDLPRAVCHANHTARIAMRVAIMPKIICSIESSSMTCMSSDQKRIDSLAYDRTALERWMRQDRHSLRRVRDYIDGFGSISAEHDPRVRSERVRVAP